MPSRAAPVRASSPADVAAGRGTALAEEATLVVVRFADGAEPGLRGKPPAPVLGADLATPVAAGFGAGVGAADGTGAETAFGACFPSVAGTVPGTGTGTGTDTGEDVGSTGAARLSTDSGAAGAVTAAAKPVSGTMSVPTRPPPAS